MEKPVTPDEPDVLDALDAGDALQGLGVDVLASGSSSASGWLVISVGGTKQVEFRSRLRIANHSFFGRLLRSHGGEPRKVVTDKLRS